MKGRRGEITGETDKEEIRGKKKKDRKEEMGIGKVERLK